jgi:RecA-family ATPase
MEVTLKALEAELAAADAQAREPRIRFFTPSELRDFKPDNELVLIGDCHVTRGEVFVMGGEPGVGKSLAGTQLAVCGATGQDWFGLGGAPAVSDINRSNRKWPP